MEVSQFLIEGPWQKVVNSLQVSKSDPIVRRIFFSRPETRFLKIQNHHPLGGRSNFSTNFSSVTIVSDKIYLVWWKMNLWIKLTSTYNLPMNRFFEKMYIWIASVFRQIIINFFLRDFAVKIENFVKFLYNK